SPSAAASAATAIAAVAATAAAKAAFGLRPRFVDGQRESTHLILVELGCGLLRFLVRRHFDERESARPSGRRVTHDAYCLYRPRFAEELLELCLTGGVRQVADV